MRRDLGQRRQWAEVLGGDLSTSWERLRLGLAPAVRAQELCSDSIDVVAPWREHLHVRPRGYVGADTRSGLEHDERLAARREMRGGGESDGTAADDGDGILMGYDPQHAVLLPMVKPCAAGWDAQQDVLAGAAGSSMS